MNKSDFSRAKRKMIRFANQIGKTVARGNKRGLPYIAPLKTIRAARSMRLRDCAFPA